MVAAFFCLEAEVSLSVVFMKEMNILKKILNCNRFQKK